MSTDSELHSRLFFMQFTDLVLLIGIYIQGILNNRRQKEIIDLKKRMEAVIKTVYDTMFRLNDEKYDK